MRRATAVGIVLALLLPLLLTLASAEQAGDVTFSSDSIALSPSSPAEGDDLGVTVTLANAVSIETTGVEVSLHGDNISNLAFHQETVSIAADGFVQVEGTWTDIPFGSHSVILVVSHGGQSANVSKAFQVSGLVDLVASNLVLDPVTGLHQGDLVNLSIDITNSGNLGAGQSHLLLQLDGNLLNEISVPPLPAGQSTTVDTSFNAPPAGQHHVTAFANSQSSSDGIVESDIDNNDATSPTFTVLTHPDYLHHAQPDPQIQATTPVGSLAGPWTLSGEILRMGGQGASSIDVAIMRVQGETETTVRVFTLSFSESSPLQSWEEELTETQLQITDSGMYVLRVRIDPSRLVPQSIQFNDDLDIIITSHPEPNVAVSPHAAASTDTVLSGESVTFEVTVTNVGVIPVIGSLTATFDGQSLTPILGVGIPSGEERTFTFMAPASGDVNRVIPFTSSWEANVASYDSDPNDNQASGSVTLHSNLKLRFLQETESWTPSDTPLVYGTTYTYTIDVTSDEGTGDETFTCLDHLENRVLGTRQLSFNDTGETAVVICSFEAGLVGPFELYIVPEGGTVATWTASWTISATGSADVDSDSSSITGAVVLFIIAAVLLIGVLIAAVILTRASEEEVERGTFDYCPSCDGEIEGHEDVCPHCDFDLASGQSQFHDCPSCESNIPDMMEHCPYCGEVQDITSFYERRERKESAQSEETEEEQEEDWDEVVRGSDGFDDTLEELGFEADQYESEWDSRLEAAEQDLDDAEDWRLTQEDIPEEDATEIVETQLRSSVQRQHDDIDDIIGDKKGRRHLTDEQVELSASDAEIRADLYKLTGEEGVLPGEQVDAEFLPDHSVVGNELKGTQDVPDFTVGDDDEGNSKKRRAPRRKDDESTE